MNRDGPHPEVIRRRGISYCGAYWGNGFHEDGFNSALAVCAAFGVDPNHWNVTGERETPVTGPTVMSVFLLSVSGVALLEKDLKRRKPGYLSYIRRTNAFFPWFPSREE